MTKNLIIFSNKILKSDDNYSENSLSCNATLNINKYKIKEKKIQ